MLPKDLIIIVNHSIIGLNTMELQTSYLGLNA